MMPPVTERAVETVLAPSEPLKEFTLASVSDTSFNAMAALVRLIDAGIDLFRENPIVNRHPFSRDLSRLIEQDAASLAI